MTTGEIFDDANPASVALANLDFYDVVKFTSMTL